ncbi:MAG: hypothetical protein ABI045_01985 [Flavobacteriales bacterium]
MRVGALLNDMYHGRVIKLGSRYEKQYTAGIVIGLIEQHGR